MLSYSLKTSFHHSWNLHVRPCGIKLTWRVYVHREVCTNLLARLPNVFKRWSHVLCFWNPDRHKMRIRGSEDLMKLEKWKIVVQNLMQGAEWCATKPSVHFFIELSTSAKNTSNSLLRTLYRNWMIWSFMECFNKTGLHLVEDWRFEHIWMNSVCSDERD